MTITALCLLQLSWLSLINNKLLESFSSASLLTNLSRKFQDPINAIKLHSLPNMHGFGSKIKKNSREYLHNIWIDLQWLWRRFEELRRFKEVSTIARANWFIIKSQRIPSYWGWVEQCCFYWPVQISKQDILLLKNQYY